jgi:hypothetical protein
MILRLPTENENGACLRPNRSCPSSPSFPHAFSGNPGRIRTGPPIKTFGRDGHGDSHLFTSAAIFEGTHARHEEEIFTQEDAT